MMFMRNGVVRRWNTGFRSLCTTAKTSWLAAARKRGLVDAVTSESCSNVFDSWTSRSQWSAEGKTSCPPCSVYVGQDPTAPSLHVGNLLPLVLMKHMSLHGIRPVALVGSATGRIGDPSGKSSERPQLGEEQLQTNLAGIQRSVEQVLCRDGDHDYYAARLSASGELPELWHGQEASPRAEVVQNGDFYRDMSALDFIGGVGRHFRMSTMLSKDSVKSRLASEAGLSFTEFTYQVLQAWDFWTLYREHGCAMQIGGSDQWGNIVAGVDLVRRMCGDEVYGITVPLLTNAAGRKIGKSEGNAAVWLNPEQTPHYTFYQYFVRMSDDDAANLLPKLTLLPMRDVDTALQEHAEAPHLRHAQQLLADEVTRMVRGRDALDIARAATSTLHGSESQDQSSPGAVAELAACVQAGTIPGSLLDSAEALQGSSVLELAQSTGLASSKAEARRLAKAGGLSLNGSRVDAKEASAPIGPAGVLHGQVAVIGAGKARRHVAAVGQPRA